jgi:hypothetical protein
MKIDTYSPTKRGTKRKLSLEGLNLSPIKAPALVR